MKEAITALMVICYTAVGCFGSLPQIIKTFRTKSVKDMSILSWLMWTASSLSYLLYALFVNPEFELLFTAGLDAAFNTIILSQVIFYGVCRRDRSDTVV